MSNFHFLIYNAELSFTSLALKKLLEKTDLSLGRLGLVGVIPPQRSWHHAFPRSHVQEPYMGPFERLVICITTSGLQP